MRVVPLLTTLLLTASLSTLVVPSASALTGGCDGVVVSSNFTGHCGDTCNGTVYLNGNRWADHICPGPIFCNPDCNVASTESHASTSSADSSANLFGGCDGVSLRGTFTGHCGNTCYGSVYVLDIWIADHYCTNLA